MNRKPKIPVISLLALGMLCLALLLGGFGSWAAITLIDGAVVASGRIEVDGIDMGKFNMATLRRSVAIVQQDSFIFKGSIAENVDVGRGLSEKALLQALQDVGLADFIASNRDGVHYQLAEKGSNLSIGQRQMISFARALAGNPKILILDEATANVDSDTERKIQLALLKTRGDRTIIAIAHRLSTITSADQILVLHHVEVQKTGSHRELMNTDGLYKHMF